MKKSKKQLRESTNTGRISLTSLLTERAEKQLSDSEQKKIESAIEKASGVSAQSDITDTRYNSGVSDFGLSGGGDTLLFVGKTDDGGYRVSVEDGSKQLASKTAKNFGEASKIAAMMAKKFKKQLTTESVNEAYGNDAAMNQLFTIIKKAPKNLSADKFAKLVTKKTGTFRGSVDQDQIKQLWNDYLENPKTWKYDDSKYRLEESVNEEIKIGSSVMVNSIKNILK